MSDHNRFRPLKAQLVAAAGRVSLPLDHHARGQAGTHRDSFQGELEFDFYPSAGTLYFISNLLLPRGKRDMQEKPRLGPLGCRRWPSVPLQAKGRRRQACFKSFVQSLGTACRRCELCYASTSSRADAQHPRGLLHSPQHPEHPVPGLELVSEAWGRAQPPGWPTLLRPHSREVPKIPWKLGQGSRQGFTARRLSLPTWEPSGCLHLPPLCPHTSVGKGRIVAELGKALLSQAEAAAASCKHGFLASGPDHTPLCPKARQTLTVSGLKSP